jgi:hypothetical protein
MIVVMVAAISGPRNGIDWPRPGQTIDVPDREAAELIASGLAKAAPVAVAKAKPVVETAAVSTAGVETEAMPPRPAARRNSGS